MSPAPIESKSSGTSLTPARTPIRRCAGSPGTANGTNSEGALPILRPAHDGAATLPDRQLLPAGHPARGYIASRVARSPDENPGRGRARCSRRAAARPRTFVILATGDMTEPASSECPRPRECRTSWTTIQPRPIPTSNDPPRGGPPCARTPTTRPAPSRHRSRTTPPTATPPPAPPAHGPRAATSRTPDPRPPPPAPPRTTRPPGPTPARARPEHRRSSPHPTQAAPTRRTAT